MALVHPATLAEVAAFAVPALGSFARRGFASNRRKIGDAAVSGAVQTPLTLITSVPVAQWVRSDLGIVLGGTLLASGTTPPALTLTGSFPGPPPAFRIVCSGGGALGVWTGQISYDNGATIAQVFTSAATVNLAGPSTGVTLNIAAGTANVDNLWLSTVAAWSDQSGNARDFSQGTAGAQPVYVANDTTLNNRPKLTLDGTAQFLVSTWTRPAPATTPTWMAGIIKQVTSVSTRQLFGDNLSSKFIVRQTGVSPNLLAFSTAGGNTNEALAIGA